MSDIAEEGRLTEHQAARADWKKWGPYLSERAWGTVREDYSSGGDAWEYLPHDHARSRAYRWNEDGLAGISDSRQQLCFALARWNGQDAILKECLFGLTNGQGNHGEDLKEYYTPKMPSMPMLSTGTAGQLIRKAREPRPPPSTSALWMPGRRRSFTHTPAGEALRTGRQLGVNG